MALKTARPRHTPPRRSRFLLLWLWSSALVTLGAATALFFADVRLGQGYFAILYSPIADWRMARVLPALVIAGAAAGGVWTMGQRERSNRIAGRIFLIASMLGAGVWLWWAPPEPGSQHAFSFTSLSTDGAFVVESKEAQPSLRRYLHSFPTTRLQRSVQEMGGSRVLSNPPLMTVIAGAGRGSEPYSAETAGWLERKLVNDYGVQATDVINMATALRFSAVLTAMWVLSGFAAYALGRQFLSPIGAAVFAAIVTFNPCTVHYAPGKDPGQLLTINLMLWAWFSAWRRRSFLRAALCGALFTIGCTSGLIHIWVAGIAVLATLWQSTAKSDRRTWIRLGWNVLGAAGGVIVVCMIAWAALDWKIPLTLLAVSRKWNDANAAIVRSRPIWFVIGLPIFLLFLSPGLWTLLGLAARRWRMNFGVRLLLCSMLVMAFTYVALGVTNELPRLWIAFLPTLTLGAATATPLLRGSSRRRRLAAALAMIVGVQILFTALHWTLFDARESEQRLMDRRFYN
jgi:hypothetical protein